MALSQAPGRPDNDGQHDGYFKKLSGPHTEARHEKRQPHEGESEASTEHN